MVGEDVRSRRILFQSRAQGRERLGREPVIRQYRSEHLARVDIAGLELQSPFDGQFSSVDPVRLVEQDRLVEPHAGAVWMKPGGLVDRHDGRACLALCVQRVRKHDQRVVKIPAWNRSLLALTIQRLKTAPVSTPISRSCSCRRRGADRSSAPLRRPVSRLRYHLARRARSPGSSGRVRVLGPGLRPHDRVRSPGSRRLHPRCDCLPQSDRLRGRVARRQTPCSPAGAAGREVSGAFFLPTH